MLPECAEGEPSYIVGRNTSLYDHGGEQCGNFSKINRTKSNDLAISLLNIYSMEMKSTPWRHIYTSMFTAELFTIIRM
jgi:hypothetical protein